jgi:hypothetical protein
MSEQIKRDSQKHEIVVVGTVDANGQTHNWVFDGTNSAYAAHTIRADGTRLIGGWSIEQLREIANTVQG